jgi:hypothetical protein
MAGWGGVLWPVFSGGQVGLPTLLNIHGKGWIPDRDHVPDGRLQWICLPVRKETNKCPVSGPSTALGGHLLIQTGAALGHKTLQRFRAPGHNWVCCLYT